MGNFIDLTGKRFGQLTVIKRSGHTSYGEITWECLCDCGGTVISPGANLRRGDTTKCGNHRINDISGQRFGTLVVVKRSGSTKNGQAKWLCKCDCGKEKVIEGSNLRCGHVTSCGCQAHVTHGMSHERIYKIFASIHTRCKDKSDPVYGGKGIKVSKEWEHFEPFLEWSLQNGYSDELTIDRIDSDGDYSPDNCRWADMYIQARNKGLFKNNKTGYSGVSTYKGKYVAQLNLDGRTIYLGRHSTLLEAAKARRDAELKYWGWTKIEL